MSILILGGGFVGKALAHTLTPDHQFSVLSRTHNVNANYGQIICDLETCSQRYLEDVFKNFELLLITAWCVGEDYLTNENNMRWPEIYTKILDAAVESRSVKRVVGIGSCLEYDLRVNEPFCCPAQEHQRNIRPSHSLPYVVAKRTVTAVLRGYKQYFDCVQWVRLFNLFGPEFGEHGHRLVPTLSKSSNGDELFLSSPGLIRDFSHILDAAESIVGNIVTPYPESKVYNACSGVPSSVEQFVNRYCAQEKKILNITWRKVDERFPQNERIVGCTKHVLRW